MSEDEFVYKTLENVTVELLRKRGQHGIRIKDEDREETSALVLEESSFEALLSQLEGRL